MVIEDQTRSYLSGSYIDKWIDHRTRGSKTSDIQFGTSLQVVEIIKS